MYKDVPRKFMPVLWFEQHVVATEKVGSIVKLILAAPLAGQILGVVFVIIGIATTLTSCACRRHDYEIPLADKSKTDHQKNVTESLPLVKISYMK